MGWSWHIWVSRELQIGFWQGNLRERVHLEHLCTDGRIILKWIFKKWYGGWTGLIWLRTGTREGSCEYDTEPMGSIICGTFLG